MDAAERFTALVAGILTIISILGGSLFFLIKISFKLGEQNQTLMGLGADMTRVVKRLDKQDERMNRIERRRIV